MRAEESQQIFFLKLQKNDVMITASATIIISKLIDRKREINGYSIIEIIIMPQYHI